MARDITAEKAAAERLKATEEALRQSQKMEAVGQLTGGIAHDFNNLLPGIIGSARDLLQRRSPRPARRRRALHRRGAMTAANRAAALTHRLLAFSRRQPLDPRSVRRQSADRLAGGSAAPHHRRAHRARDLAGGRPVADALRPQPAGKRAPQPRHQRARRHAGWRPADDRDRQRRARQRDSRRRATLSPGEYVCISVTDTGVGMSAGQVAAARLRSVLHHQADRAGHRARAVDDLWLRPPVGRPRQDRQRARRRARRSSSTCRAIVARTRCRSRRRRVDAPTCRRPARPCWWSRTSRWCAALILEVLAELGYRALEAADGRDGLRHPATAPAHRSAGHRCRPARPERPPARRRRPRETRPDLKVLFITGYAESVAMADGFLEPGMEMITKPFELDNLSRRIRAMVSGWR